MAGRLNPGARPRHGLALAALALGVAAVHGCLTLEMADRMAELRASADMPARIEVAYVRELDLAPPPAAAPVAVSPPPAAARVAPPKPAASAAVAKLKKRPPPEPSPPEPPAPPEPAAVPEPLMATAPVPTASAPLAEPAASAPEPAASSATMALAAAAPASAASAPAERFDWPASTRLSYTLTGNVRGEVHGSAQVEWVRMGSRYQVHLDVTVGLPIAPLMTRRMSSDGTLGPQGLVPQRYDEDTKVAFRDRRRVTMSFEPDAVVLGDGRRLPRLPGVQDTASQFVQLAWLFTVRPELLRSGSQVEVPLALPRSMDRWVYDVLEEETLYLPFGHAQAFHLKPRRVSRPGGELIAEIWFSPQLRYLPARIRIQQDEQTFIDLQLSRKPELAGP
jgi:hypothetical protein